MYRHAVLAEGGRSSVEAYAALDVQRKLPTQEQILRLARLARSKGEPQPSQHFSSVLCRSLVPEHCSRPLDQHVSSPRRRADLAVTPIKMNSLYRNSLSLTRERLAAYRKLLRDAGTPRGFKALSDGAGYDFYFWLRGSAIADDVQKGFAYRTSPPPGIVQPCITGRDRRDWLIEHDVGVVTAKPSISFPGVDCINRGLEVIDVASHNC